MDHNHHHQEHDTGPEKKNRHAEGGHSHHHQHMVEDFKKRFWISLVVTIPILVLSHMIQDFLGLGETLHFSGDLYISFILEMY